MTDDRQRELTKAASRQELLDAFYWRTGPCCAGCDWWRHLNSVAGECSKNAPVASGDRIAMLGIRSPSIDPGAGHILTWRHHRCGDFSDSFDWPSLPLPYLSRIGAHIPP